jgi:hypothetical protein
MARPVRCCASEAPVEPCATVIEAVLGHKKAGIQKVYQRHDFLDEKRMALEAWSKYLPVCSIRPRGRTSFVFNAIQRQ